MTDSKTPAEPLVVAEVVRDNSRAFTPITSIGELLEAAQKHVPIDRVFLVQESSGGYAFREAGRLVVTFQAIGELPPVPELPALPSSLGDRTMFDKPTQNKPAPQPAPKRGRPRGKVKPGRDKPIQDKSEPVAPPASATKTQSGAMTTDGFTVCQPGEEDNYSDIQGFD